ncbi:AMP-dependent synthetase/ligase [Nocardioides limicola]|uniref:AMP-dependent synthetase/ligase n=1 Tax=Nocardioides limicola TaxID=2803368 RepID=UPI00193C1982|nr:AMP-dependent synthetase/ligase [Nocardioides sp. DJM-14]
MSNPTTFPEAFQQTVAAHSDELALRNPDDSISLTWRQYGDEVRRIAGGLAALGLKRGDTFMSMLTNRPEFNLTEVAASHLGATTYSGYNTNSAEQINYLLTHADTKIVVTEQQFVDRIKASGVELAHLLVVENGDLDKLQPTDDFDFAAAWRAVQPEDVLCLIYTSGTTGNPKGVEHTHGGVLRLIDSLETYWPLEPGDSTISYLPSCHAADRFFCHYYAFVKGAQVTSVADPTQLPQVLPQVRPTTFAAVPRIWEKLKFGVEAQLGADEKLAAAFEAGVPQVVDAVRAKIGFDRLKWALSGAAAIPPHVHAFMQKLGLPVVEMWGMSECMLGTGTTPDEARIGTIGKIAPGAEAKVLDDGELLVRMPWLMRGYRNEPERTAEAIDADGWLHSGDVVVVDDAGYFKIVDRKKELIVNSGGKNMSPSNIEGAISAGSPLVGPTLVYGDGKSYNVALITLDPEVAAIYAGKLGLDADPAGLVKDERVLAEIQASVDAGNEKLSRIEQIKRFTVLPDYWLPGGDEMTPTSKLKRRPITRKYAAEIDSLYASTEA